MKKLILFAALLIPCLSVFGQQPAASSKSTPEADNDVVRISTKLVQFDVLVVDKDGKQVRDLKPDDFQVLQDGKPKKITNFSYVDTEPNQQTADPKGSTSAVPVKTSSIAGKRIITFIVDDGSCTASNLGMRASREGIEKFVREQMQPHDLVAIYKTRSGSSMLQQYTGDKVQILKAAEKIQWRPALGICGESDGSFFEKARSNTFETRTGTQNIESSSDQKSREHFEDAATNNQVVASLGVVRYVIQGLQHVPGRKVVFFMSDGIPFRSRGGELVSAGDRLRDLTDLANRSSVVFNTIDDRGVFDETMIEARDEVYATDNSSTIRSRDRK